MTVFDITAAHTLTDGRTKETKPGMHMIEDPLKKQIIVHVAFESGSADCIFIGFTDETYAKEEFRKKGLVVLAGFQETINLDQIIDTYSCATT